MHIDLTTTSQSLAGTAANRTFALFTTDPTCVVHIYAADTTGLSGATNGIFIAELTYRAPKLEITDGSTYLMYVLKQGTVTGAVWVDAHAAPTAGPAGPTWISANNWAAVTGTSYVASAGEFVKVNTGVATTVTLPSAVGIAGQRIRIQDATGTANTHNITIATTSSQTIQGTTPVAISTANGGQTYVSDGSNWFYG